MDVNRAVSAPFKDFDWPTKVALGGLWSFLGITGPAVYGYMIEYIRNVASGHDQPLPDWHDFGGKWVKGFLAGLAGLLYALPALVLFGAGVAVVFTRTAAAGALESGDIPPEAWASGSVLFLLGGLYSLVVAVVVLSAVVDYAMTGEFAAFFSFGRILGRLADGRYWSAWLLYMGLTIVGGIVGGIVGSVLGYVPIVGAFASAYVGGVVGFIASIMGGHCFGQYAAGAYGLPGPGAAGASGFPMGPQGGYVPPAPPAPPADYTPPAPPSVPEPPAPPSPPAPNVAPQEYAPPPAPEPLAPSPFAPPAPTADPPAPASGE